MRVTAQKRKTMEETTAIELAARLLEACGHGKMAVDLLCEIAELSE